MGTPRLPRLDPVVHKGLAEWDETVARLKNPHDPVLWARPTHRARSPDLLETYLDQRELEQDMLVRPDHYSREQHEALAKLKKGEAVPARERSELLLNFMRSTAAKATARAITTKATEPDPEVEQAINDPSGKGGGGTFEDQDFGPSIIII